MEPHDNNLTPDVEADLQVVIDHLTTGQPLDAETARRIRERSERATQEIRDKHGVLDVAVDLIREIRDEE